MGQVQPELKRFIARMTSVSRSIYLRAHVNRDAEYCAALEGAGCLVFLAYRIAAVATDAKAVSRTARPSATGLGTAFRRNFADFSDRLQDSRPRKRQTVDHPSPYWTRALFAMTTADVGSAYRHWDGSEHKHG